MATKRWIGKALSVAQVATGAITAYDSSTTYKVTIGGVVVSVTGDTDVNTTAAALVTALEASTHPYFTAVDWTNPSAPSASVVGTALTAGVPFEATLTVSGGTGTVTAFAATQDSKGPNHWDDADNFEGGVLPVAADDVVIENCSSEILYGLDTISADLGDIFIFKTFTGKIGLDSMKFSTGAGTSDSDAAEYRETYMKISAANIEIGQQVGPGNPAGSTRIKINNIKAAASLLTVFATASGASEPFLPAMRYKANNTGADVVVMGAQGGVGVGKDYNGETATLGDITIRTANSSDKLFIGSGVTYTNYEQFGGTNVIDAAATLTAVDVTGGNLEINGDFTITTLTNDGGSVVDNHIKTSGSAITTLNNTSGTFDLNDSNVARTIATLNQGRDAKLKIDPNVVTVTTFNEPSDPYEMDTKRI